MNVKLSVPLMLLLISGIFAMTIVLADEGASKGMKQSQSEGGMKISDLSSGGIDSEEVSEVLEEAEMKVAPKQKRTNPVVLWEGYGWIENSEEGHLMTGLWAFKNLSASDGYNKSSAPRTFGRIRISGSGVYKLVRQKENSSGENINFYVVPSEKILTLEDLGEYSIGNLSLSKNNVLNGLTTWKGSLIFSSGDLAGEWNVNLGTITKNVGPKKIAAARRIGRVKRKALDEAGVKNVEELNDEQKAELEKKIRRAVAKRSFWRRIRFWRRD